MASKAQQDFLSAVNDTFPKGTNERRAFTRFAETGLNVNRDPQDFDHVAKVLNWTKIGQTVKRQAGR